MDNKGWGLPEMLILSALIIFALIIAVVNIKKLQNSISDHHSDITVEKVEDDESTSNDDLNNEDEIKSENNSVDEDKTENNDYTGIENKMVKAAQQYVEQNFKADNNITIIVDKLHLTEQDKTLDDEMTKNNCAGYVKVTNDNVNFYYTTYLKCNDYISDGYDNSYE